MGYFLGKLSLSPNTVGCDWQEGQTSLGEKPTLQKLIKHQRLCWFETIILNCHISHRANKKPRHLSQLQLWSSMKRQMANWNWDHKYFASKYRWKYSCWMGCWAGHLGANNGAAPGLLWPMVAGSRGTQHCADQSRRMKYTATTRPDSDSLPRQLLP